MRMRSGLALVAVGFLTACGETAPQAPRTGADATPPAANATPSAPVLRQNEKIVFAFDEEPSWTVADPGGLRGQALVTYLDSVRSSDTGTTSVGVFVFSGFTAVWLTHGGTPGFDDPSSWDQIDQSRLEGEVLGYGADSNSVDFVSPLNGIYSAIASDEGAATTNSNTFYRVIFVTDTMPSNDSSAVLTHCQALRALSNARATVVLDTVFLYEPAVASPSSSASAENSAAFLRQMAQAGGGHFDDVEGQTPLSFQF